MKRIFVFCFLVCLILSGLYGIVCGDEIKKEDLFFLSSLHYTTRGMAFWYDKDNGGLETLTGIPYSKLPCYHCHVSSCDTCHKVTKDGKFAYSTEAARNQKICLECHAREASIQKMDEAANQKDVHSAKGMQCMNCHNAREIHGDGTEYESMKQPGMFDTSCEKCHAAIKPSVSHTIHRERLDCKSCHVRHVVSCYNCHFETLINEDKKVAIPLSGWVFLMNYNGKVTSANMQTFVIPGNKTFLMFAPQNSHSIMKDGRQCGDCHGTDIVKKVQDGKLSLTWLEGRELKNVKGIVPVVEGAAYECIYENYKNGQWIPIEDAPKPLLHYAGHGSPLTKEQLKKMALPMGKR
ncbi:MAG: hypothetical protein AB1390_05540 [Nitrospirota bacterium]